MWSNTSRPIESWHWRGVGLNHNMKVTNLSEQKYQKLLIEVNIQEPVVATRWKTNDFSHQCHFHYFDLRPWKTSWTPFVKTLGFPSEIKLCSAPISHRKQVFLQHFSTEREYCVVKLKLRHRCHFKHEFSYNL